MIEFDGPDRDRISVRTPTGRALGAASLLVAGLLGAGCEWDSFFDPSVVGRWEHTPTVAPILERIDVIERDDGEFVEKTTVEADDLVPQVADYRIGPGDGLYLEIFDFIQAGVPTPFERVVDARGEIDLPQIGKVRASGLTDDELRERIRSRLREAGIIEDALVSVQTLSRRAQTFSVIGAVGQVGRFVIPEPDYRLLEALTEAGGVLPSTKSVFVIRQVALAEEVERGAGIAPRGPSRPDQPPTPDPTGPDLEQLIRDLTEGDGGSFGMLAPQGQTGGGGGGTQQPPIDLPDEEEDVRRDPPPIDLVEEPAPRGRTQRDGAQSPDAAGSWMFLNGEWVRVAQGRAPAANGLPDAPDVLSQTTAAELVTQRVIEVPVEPLLQGAAEYNIVIRPGDVIRVPGPAQGFVYLAGPGVARPGVYSLPQIGRLTLTKAVLSAGGLSGLAVPWRVDLIRMIGDDRQATIRLNLNAIAAGTEPDIFLKADDMVNVGTAFWAQPLAIARNGFRATYGFGFLLDRNFGNDVFGAPPVNRGF